MVKGVHSADGLHTGASALAAVRPLALTMIALITTLGEIMQ